MLAAVDLVKRYGGVTALDGAGLELVGGEIHALVGENGAGKSTMVKIISGVQRPDGGHLIVDRVPVHPRSAREAAALGIALVSQELSLFPDLSVGENLFPAAPPLRRGLLDRAAMERLASPVLHELGLRVSTRTRLGSLGLADRQLIEISRALLTGPKVLILDEPTSALPAPAVARLATVLRRVATRGIAVLYISHALDEVRQLATRVSVLRDGRIVVAGVPTGRVGLDDLVRAMLGHPPPAASGAAHGVARGADGGRTTGGPPVLVLDRIGVPGHLAGVTLAVGPGEIVGLAGLEDSGHRAVLDVVCGLVRPSAGTVVLPGGAAPRSVRHAVALGVALVPGDRRRLGLMPDRPVWENATSARWLGQGRGGRWLRRRRLADRAAAVLGRMRFRGGLSERADALSGGNQQKVVFAKWVDADPALLVLDDPTRGVDVGARAEMHDIVRDLATGGRAVVMTSTDLPELAELCHRVVVFRRGRVTATLAGAGLTAHGLATAMNAAPSGASR